MTKIPRSGSGIKMFSPFAQEILYENPAEFFALFSNLTGAIFLDSAQLRTNCGRFSFVALDPFLILRSKNNSIELNNDKILGNPFEILKKQLKRFALNLLPDLPPFQGGVAGLFSYDLYQHLEKIPSARLDDMNFPDLILGFYDLVIGFDNELKKAWIFSSGFPLQDKEAREARAQKRIQFLLKKIKNKKRIVSNGVMANEIHSNFTSKNYQQAVRKVVDYILAGDIFQTNISQRFKTELPDNFSLWDFYCRLRAINPAPFAAYLNFSDTTLVSASPERFLKLQNNLIETRPIKGTCARSHDSSTDEQLKQNLLNSKKDRAENIMIVDLLRNDLSRVCEDHSVDVLKLCDLESYANVHHLVSVITGQLRTGYNAVDLLRVAFPGGSITGAPKIRAMEIIAEIEPTARGPYCGSIGYIGFNGDMDTSITIRTVAIKNNIATFQAGGAIVAESDPEAEYEETLTKIKLLKRALTQNE